MRTAARTPQRSRNQRGKKAIKTTAVPAEPAQKRQLEKAVSRTSRERLGYLWNRLRRTLQELNGATPPDGRAAGALDTRRPPLARLGLLALLALAVGCSSSSTTGTSASSAAPAASASAAAGIIRSHYYGYLETLPAGWHSSGQATQRWDGTSAPDDADTFVDLFTGPGSVEAWVAAAPTRASLAGFTTAIMQAASAAHPCPATPPTDQAIEIGGAPARLLGMQCPPGSGFFVELATVVHNGTGFLFTSLNRSVSPSPSADRVAFRKFLAGIQLQR
jgi:hypothetical protein